MRAQAAPRFSREERIALGVAVALHVALIGALVVGAHVQPPLVPTQRMTVTFSDNVSLKSTSPEPAAAAMPDVAQTRGEAQPEPEPPLPMTPPEPQVAPRPQPQPAPAPRPTAAPERPAPPRRAERPAPPQPREERKPAPQKQAAKPADERPRRRPDAPEGGSLIGKDFLKGVPDSSAPGTAKTPPADAIGPAVVASLASAISRQLKPHWIAPQGADAEKLVTLVRFRLDQNGRLVGQPEVVGQSGVTPSNRAQAPLHAENAIKAVKLAAPFNLPAQYYSAWRVITTRFDKRLSQ